MKKILPLMLIAVIVLAAEASNDHTIAAGKTAIGYPGILSERIWIYALSAMVPVFAVSCEGNQGVNLKGSAH
jgi:hypothetical protein